MFGCPCSLATAEARHKQRSNEFKDDRLSYYWDGHKLTGEEWAKILDLDTTAWDVYINQPYYREGLFPRLKNETLEVMNGFAYVNPEGKRSGKCIGLGMLWAAALAVWGRFPLDRIIITGNRAHMFVFLDVEDGHLLNNTKWFSSTRINNRSELSEFVRLVASSPETTFVYNPVVGMCHCLNRVSQIPRPHVTNIYANISRFISNPLKHPNPDHIQFVESAHQIPDPLEYDSAQSYRDAVVELAQQYPDSIYEFAQR